MTLPSPPQQSVDQLGEFFHQLEKQGADATDQRQIKRRQQPAAVENRAFEKIFVFVVLTHDEYPQKPAWQWITAASIQRIAAVRQP